MGIAKFMMICLGLGERCCPNRVARLKHHSWIKAQSGYNKRPGYYGVKSAVVATNEIKLSFNILEPYQVWVTDITYIRNYEGWLYLAVIIDLYSHRVLGWSMQSHMQIDLVLIARLMAFRRRKPTFTVIINSDQESRFTSLEWKSSLKKHNLAGSMCRRGICYDNTVAESLFTY